MLIGEVVGEQSDKFILGWVKTLERMGPAKINMLGMAVGNVGLDPRGQGASPFHKQKWEYAGPAKPAGENPSI